ncbi:MAG: hypothetical protein ACI9OJ_002602 [Myxococcota bacterium]|jgi:hypothetical protein
MTVVSRTGSFARGLLGLSLVVGSFSCDQLKVPEAPGGDIPGIGGRDENSGGDHVRGKAVEIKLGETHDDHVSAPAGDHTDWKKFTLGGPTVLSIDAWWDDPSVDAVISVRDQFGGNIFQLHHKPGERSNHWPGMKMRDGEFYLEVVATNGTSVYTLELMGKGYTGGSPGVQPGGSVAPPE